MGFGDFLKGTINTVMKPLGKMTGFGTDGTNAAILSGIPFVGEGFAQQEQQRFSSAQATRQMHFQKEMSSTKHQREVDDLRAAGLNPILSAHSGASTPVGASGSSTPSSGGGASAKLIEQMYRKERQKSDSEIAKNAQAVKVGIAQEKHFANSAKKHKADADFMNARQKEVDRDNALYEKRPWLHEAEKYINATGKAVTGLTGGLAGGLVGGAMRGYKKGKTFRDNTAKPFKKGGNTRRQQNRQRKKRGYPPIY